MLVFCRAGISRSAAICIAYLMQQRRMSMDEAHDYVKSRRSFISPNLNFMRQLHEFDARLSADRVCSDCTPTTATVEPLSPSRPALRSLQYPSVDRRCRWLSAAPLVDPDATAALSTGRRASATPRHRCLPVGLGHPAAALLSIVSPGFRLGSTSAPTAGCEWASCRRERSSASTPSQTSKRMFVYPLPLNVGAKTGLV